MFYNSQFCQWPFWTAQRQKKKKVERCRLLAIASSVEQSLPPTHRNLCSGLRPDRRLEGLAYKSCPCTLFLLLLSLFFVGGCPFFHPRSAKQISRCLATCFVHLGRKAVVWCNLGSHYASFMRTKHCPDSRGLPKKKKKKPSLVLTLNPKHHFSSAEQNIRWTSLSISRITSVISCASLTGRICFVHIYFVFYSELLVVLKWKVKGLHPNPCLCARK